MGHVQKHSHIHANSWQIYYLLSDISSFILLYITVYSLDSSVYFFFRFVFRFLCFSFLPFVFFLLVDTLLFSSRYIIYLTALFHYVTVNSLKFHYS
jgi:hypothetical protein